MSASFENNCPNCGRPDGGDHDVNCLGVKPKAIELANAWNAITRRGEILPGDVVVAGDRMEAELRRLVVERDKLDEAGRQVAEELAKVAGAYDIMQAERDKLAEKLDALAKQEPVAWRHWELTYGGKRTGDYALGGRIPPEQLYESEPLYAGPSEPHHCEDARARVSDALPEPAYKHVAVDYSTGDTPSLRMDCVAIVRGTPAYTADQMHAHYRKGWADALAQSADTVRLNEIAREYYALEPFEMPTGAGDADVGWRVTQWHCGELTPRIVAVVYKDDPRAAIDAALQPAAVPNGKEGE